MHYPNLQEALKQYNRRAERMDALRPLRDVVVMLNEKASIYGEDVFQQVNGICQRNGYRLIYSHYEPDDTSQRRHYTDGLVTHVHQGGLRAGDFAQYVLDNNLI